MTIEPIEYRYRGYVLVTNELGTDIWYGSDHVDRAYGADSHAQAKKVVDEWLDAR